MERRVKRALAHLKNVAGHLPNTVSDGPSVRRFEGNGLQDEQVQSALDQIGWFTQIVPLSN